MVSHSDNDDLITELTKDHDELREIFDRLHPAAGPSDALVGNASGSVTGPDPETAAAPSDEEREQLVREMTVELVKHSVAEEVHLYPLIREIFPDGDELADHEIEEHAEVEQLLKDLERLDVGDPQYDVKVGKVIADVRHHAREEEDDVFPRLRDKCTPEQLHDLGDKIRRTKAIAPTHPHPSSPDTPPGNLIAGPLAGLVDRVRDTFSRS